VAEGNTAGVRPWSRPDRRCTPVVFSCRTRRVPGALASARGPTRSGDRDRGPRPRV